MLFRKFIYSLIIFMVSPRCLACGLVVEKLGSNLCKPCQQFLPIVSYSCRRCANVLFSANIDSFCANCLKTPPPFEQTFALYPYDTPIKQWISRLKFAGHLAYAKLFSDLLYEKIVEHWYQNQPLPDLIIPIPLHINRLKERGFNQSLEIAKPLAKKLHIPLAKHGLVRIRDTSAQSGLTAKNRQKNLQQAFVCTRDLRGLHIAVLDDVVTTSVTIRSACKVLKAHGARHIDIWCCARRI